MRNIMAFFVIVAVIAGCGGGGGSSSASSGGAGGGETSSFGGFKAQGFTNTDPVIVNSYLVSSIGLAGSYSNVTYRDPNPGSADNMVAYGLGSSLYVAHADFSDPRQVATNLNGYIKVAWSVDGTRIYYSTYTSPGFGLFYVKAFSNSSPVTVVGGISDFVMAQNGTQIYYGDATSGHLKRCALAGGGIADLGADPNGSYLDAITNCGSNKILIRTGVYLSAYLTDTHTFSTGWVSSSNMQYIGASPDGNHYVFTRSGDTNVYVGDIQSSSGGATLPDTYAYPTGITYCYAVGFTADGQSLWLSCPGGLYEQTYHSGYWYLTYAATTEGLGISTCNFYSGVGLQTIVGASSASGQTAAGGLIFSQDRGNKFGSIAVINAVTDSTGVISSDTSSSDAPYLVFDYQCDKIKYLGYSTQGPSLFYNMITAPDVSNGAIISVDGQTGLIASVVTYTKSASLKPIVTSTKAGVSISGKLSLVFDGAGNKIGENPSSVKIDPSGHISLK